MGRISEILAKNHDILIDQGSVSDYIDVLLKHSSTNTGDGILSDDDLINLRDKLRKNKL